ncbi:hypothetical protein SAMN05216535_3061 [Stutzerimonas xanthomarina]|uniref:Uncharacterized protein n=2 Tax=Stutzerimonas xanthomarina TaxID=271420 RepID=A0A1M5RFH6_9GAMM|nr:hypothetical protein SAMN05216535_3061 [Stutzerimonas xanthomarina]SHH25024.1 hypothetical protein SAMN02744645_3020 [Stutzerimonas xanthomarina DSM 18231]
MNALLRETHKEDAFGLNASMAQGLQQEIGV